MARFAAAAAYGSAALALVMMAGWSPAAQAQTTMTMSSWVSPQHLLTKDVLAVWAQNVEKATDGRVKFQMLAKPPFGCPGDLRCRQGRPGRLVLRDRKLHAGAACAAPAALNFRVAAHRRNQFGRLSRIHWKYFQPVGEYKGVKLLGVFTHGPGQMFNTKRPITKVEDLSGMKIRSGGGISEEMARARRFALRQAGA